MLPFDGLYWFVVTKYKQRGGQLRALVDGTKYPGFPSVIGHNPGGTGVLNTIRVSVVDDAGDIVIKNAFPSSLIQ